MLHNFIICIILGAIFLTGSRTGVITAIILIASNSIFNSKKPLKHLIPLIFMTTLICLVLLNKNLFEASNFIFLNYDISIHNDIFHGKYEGFKAFLNRPIFGSGLGHYLTEAVSNHENVINSTPIWLLAEFGLIGTCLVIAPFIYAFILEIYKIRKNTPQGILLILTISAFAVMSQFHELFYQRAFWLFFGMSMVVIHKKIVFALSEYKAPINRQSLPR